MKPIIHSISSAKSFGGTPDDYLKIHDFMDSSKGTMSDNRHRVLLHNAWAIQPEGVLERVFGTSIIVPKEDTNRITWAILQQNIEKYERLITYTRERQRWIGRLVSVRDVGEQHIMEDFNGFIPTVQDYLGSLPYAGWMEGRRHEVPPSHPHYGRTPTIRSIFKENIDTD